MGKAVASLAKLSRPRLHDAVPRERLFQLLDRARRHPIVWVGGPPGAGKTTLVGNWLEVRRIPYRWYQIDAGDADPATFFSYLVELAGDGSDRLAKLPYLTPEYLRDLSGFTRRFFQGFFARLPKRAVVVLDNAHEAAGDPLNAILGEAAPQIPIGSTLIVVSRAQPPLALSRLRANKDMVAVGWDDLRLTAEETTAIVRQAAVGAPPTPQDLHARADGWAAGLILLLAYLQRGDTERSLTSLGSRESLFAYFAGEVLDRMLPRQREILMKAALLSQVTPPIAQRLTDDPAAPETLEQLYRLQYFTDRRTEPELSFRFHDLFREFLLARAESAWSADTLDAHRSHAASLLLESGQVEEAVSLLIAAREFARIADAIEQRAGSLLAQGR
jgi:ATP/maltotriose-dependent transcriptional regulator MalT